MRWATRWGPPVNQHSEQDYSATTWGKILETADDVVDVAAMVVMARGRLRPLDIAAVSMKAIRSAMSIYRTWSRDEYIDLQGYFQSLHSTEWKYLSPLVTKMAFAGLEVKEQAIPKFFRARDGKIVESAYTARIEDFEVGWVGPPNEGSVPDAMWAKDPAKVSAFASRRLWEMAGEERLIRLVGGDNPVPYVLPTGLVETAFVANLQQRIDRFVKANVPRSLIMNGEPGAGKTVGAAWTARKLGYRTLVIEAADFVGSQAKTMTDESGMLGGAGIALAQLMRPEVLIVNDIDRLDEPDQLRLLDVFDQAKSYSKLVFATTNNYRRLIEPVRRPGRLDDFISVPGLTQSEIRELAPNCLRLAEKMDGWPVAYVKDMEMRAQVLGNEGLEEFDEIAMRLGEARLDAGIEEEDDDDVDEDDDDDEVEEKVRPRKKKD